MGSLTKTNLLDITNKIMQEYGEPIVSTVASLSLGEGYRVLNNIDGILQELYNLMGWEFTQAEDTSIATTAGTRSYSIPDSVNENCIFALLLANHGTFASATDTDPMTFVPYAIWSENYEITPDTGVTAENRGTPQYWSIFQKKIYVSPVPDDNPGNSSNGYSLLIQSQQRFANLVRADNTTSQLPVYFEDCLIAGVLSRMWATKNISTASYWRSIYEGWKKNMLADYAAGQHFSLGV